MHKAYLNLEIVQGAGTVARPNSLWSTAPAWRSLVIWACGLTSLAIALAYFAGPPAGIATTGEGQEAKWNTCGIRPGPLGKNGVGQIIKIMPPEETANFLQATAKRLHADITPKYLPLTRLVVEQKNGDGNIVIVAPWDATVHPGDIVEYRGAHTDSELPCHYVPALLARVLPAGSLGAERN